MPASPPSSPPPGTPSLAGELEQRILDHRLVDLPVTWADEVVFPYYDGLSIRNLAHTAMRLLMGRTPTGYLGSAPLDDRLWSSYQGQARRVILFISDGLGWRLLNEIMAEDAATAQIMADMVGDGALVPITSIAPSTTAAALPSIWTGAPAATTGMVGTRIMLRELGLLASLLFYRPLAGKHRYDVLEEWGLDFDTFLSAQTLGEALTQRQIPSYVLLQKDLFNSGLSRLMHRGIRHNVRHIGYTDLWITLRDLLRQTRRNRCFVNIYWSAVDGVSHLYGTVTEQSVTEIRRQMGDLRDVLLAEGVGDDRTVFLLAADHGHIPVPQHIDLNQHPPLADALHCGPGGEARFTYLYLRHQHYADALDYVREHLGECVAAVDAPAMLAAGLFGTDEPHPEAGARLGDLLLVARAGYSIIENAAHKRPPLSKHGGLSDREMLVPLLVRAL